MRFHFGAAGLPHHLKHGRSPALPKTVAFDQPLQSLMREAEIEFLRRVIPPWQSAMGLRTVLDLGCGVGYFSALLRDLGFEVTATDSRAENIAEARGRHPGIDFSVANAEDPSLSSLGRFDIVFCFGLLYHLENPFRVIRNLHALTGKLLLIESMSVPNEQPFLFVLDEPAGVDQSMGAVSFYPSDGAILKMVYRAGFPHVYQFRELPNHENYRASVGRECMRTMFAASLQPLDSALLRAANEPMPSGDLWTTDPTGITRVLRRIRLKLKRSRMLKRS
jgi:SAM-dependent methyltransferase